MKHLIFTFLGTIISAGIISQTLDDLEFGTDATLDIVTWNIEWFPKVGATTIEYVKEIIQTMEADVIAIQEIDDYDEFVNMIDELEDWEGFAISSDYLELAYIYNPEFIQVDSIYQILQDKNRELPRKPYIMKITFMEEDYVLINNHLKCCGDGYMNLDDPWDEETRRYDACVLMDEYIRENFENQNVILLGDLNDLLTDAESNNVFQVFFDDPVSYRFTDMETAEGPSSDWSYPSWPSHLDHIMISKELFDYFENPASACYTIKIDDYLENGFWEYEANVSDHRPVGLKLMPQENSSVGDNKSQISKIRILPNPTSGDATLQFNNVNNPTGIEIRNVSGQLIQKLVLQNGVSEISLNALDLKQGIYFVQLISANKLIAVEKLVIAK